MQEKSLIPLVKPGIKIPGLTKEFGSLFKKERTPKMETISITLAAISLFFYLRICGSQKKPLKSMLLNSLSGLTVLVTISVISGIMGCGIAVNHATVFLSTTLGIPGVVGMVLIKFVL